MKAVRSGVAKKVSAVVKSDQREQRHEAAREEAKAQPPDLSGIRVCSCKDMIEHVDAGSLDAIFTDPPYPREFLDTWSELAEFAVHALKPGGLLLAMTGHIYLPEVIDRLRVDGLSYRWIVAYAFLNPRTPVHSVKVSVGWKPFLVFKRDGASLPDIISHDYFKAVPRTVADKEDHEWGQTEDDMLAIADEWMEPGWKVVDPFCGAGSMLVAARSVGCKVIGSDIDAAYVDITRNKLEAMDG